MMEQREIKFRAFTKYGMGEPFTLKEGTEHGPTKGDVKWPEDTVFMQFTGLLDKNGKEIYEGDIVELQVWFDKIETKVIKYISNGFMSAFFYVDPEHGHKSLMQSDNDCSKYAVVIGHVYEKQ